MDAMRIGRSMKQEWAELVFTRLLICPLHPLRFIRKVAGLYSWRAAKRRKPHTTYYVKWCGIRLFLLVAAVDTWSHSHLRSAACRYTGDSCGSLRQLNHVCTQIYTRVRNWYVYRPIHMSVFHKHPCRRSISIVIEKDRARSRKVRHDCRFRLISDARSKIRTISKEKKNDLQWHYSTGISNVEAYRIHQTTFTIRKPLKLFLNILWFESNFS